MEKITQNIDTSLTINLNNHPGLGAARRLKLTMLVVRVAARSIEVGWDLEVLDTNLQPIPRLTERLTQSASDADFVLIEGGQMTELISQETFNKRYLNGPEILDNEGNPTGTYAPPEQPLPSAWATEYDFWWLTACAANPPQMHLLLMDAGMRFAQRRGLL